MKRSIMLILLVLACLLTLSACGCAHEEWTEANCTTPKTCVECGETEGAPLGHSWMAATCETAKTCEVCGTVEGEALGHSWTEATCEAPKTCATCGAVEGEALGHVWTEATTEAPKTCTTCAATEGERIITDERFTTASSAPLFGTWGCEVALTGEMMGIEDFDAALNCLVTMELKNDGTATLGIVPADEEEFNQVMVQYMVDALYAELAASGLDQAAADAAMEQAYGMGVEEYALYAVEQLDMASMFEELSVNGVYYVEENLLYTGSSWSDSLTGSEFTLEGDTLSLQEDIFELGVEATTFTKVVE